MTFWKNYMYRRNAGITSAITTALCALEWGLEYIVDHVNGDDPRELFRKHTAGVLPASDDFYALPPVTDFVSTAIN